MCVLIQGGIWRECISGKLRKAGMCWVASEAAEEKRDLGKLRFAPEEGREQDVYI